MPSPPAASFRELTSNCSRLPPLPTDEQVADSMGDPILCELGAGDDGVAYLLESGQVLKRTNETEAAIALELLHWRAIPGLPEIYQVIRVTGWYANEQIIGGGAPATWHYVVREFVEDCTDDPSPLAEIPQPMIPAIRRAVAALAERGINLADYGRASNVGFAEDGSPCIRDLSRGSLAPGLVAALRRDVRELVFEAPTLIPEDGAGCRPSV